MPEISVVTVNYNHEKYIGEYIESVLNCNYPSLVMIIIDNASTDRSLEVISKYPMVKVIINAENCGYSAALNQAIEAAQSSLVVITGPDVVVDKNWLSPLIEQYLQNPLQTFAVVSKVITMDRENLYSTGCSLHFTGHLNVHNMWLPINQDDCQDKPIEVGAIDSTSALIDKDKFISIGGCDPAFFIYHEEFDYCFRARMQGWLCWFTPQSVVYHGSGTSGLSVRNQGQYPAGRPFYHTRNRLYSVLKNFQLRTILGIFPLWIFVETLAFLALLKMGLAHHYLRAVEWLWKNRKMILEMRKKVQKTRKLSDNYLLSADPLTISPLVLDNPFYIYAKKILDSFLKGYWALLKRITY